MKLFVCFAILLQGFDEGNMKLIEAIIDSIAGDFTEEILHREVSGDVVLFRFVNDIEGDKITNKFVYLLRDSGRFGAITKLDETDMHKLAQQAGIKEDEIDIKSFAGVSRLLALRPEKYILYGRLNALGISKKGDVRADIDFCVYDKSQKKFIQASSYNTQAYYSIMSLPGWRAWITRKGAFEKIFAGFLFVFFIPFISVFAGRLFGPRQSRHTLIVIAVCVLLGSIFSLMLAGFELDNFFKWLLVIIAVFAGAYWSHFVVTRIFKLPLRL